MPVGQPSPGWGELGGSLCSVPAAAAAAVLPLCLPPCPRAQPTTPLHNSLPHRTPPHPPPQVGDFTKRWENGKAIVCDTSFMHETQNGTSADRIVLIMRHWHPEVSPLEQRAIQFLFDCLDNPTPGGIKAAQRAAEAGLAAAGVVAGAGRLGKKGGKKKKGAGGGGKSGSGGKGFGPPVAAA